jgi:Holliday junction resolvasome RuvABC endonuclease subunit
MSRIPTSEKRLLSIDPTHRGFGYVVLEGPERLIDWGTRHVQGPKNKASVAAVGELIGRYRPQIMVLEDVAARDCRRSRRVRELVEALDRHGRERGLTVRKIAKARVKKMFSRLGIRNKGQMARFIAARFPELARYLPPERKPWMSEDLKMAIFDAAAFGLAVFSHVQSKLMVHTPNRLNV